MLITGKGFVLQIDSLISLSIILLFFLVFFAKLSALVSSAEMQSSAGAEFFAASLSEAIVKNRNPENPVLGSAYYNPLLHRVESNVIEESLLSGIQPQDFGEYSLSALYLRDSERKNYFFGSGISGCLVVERFIILKGIQEKTSVLGVVVCG